MTITKKQINSIKTAAFEQFKNLFTPEKFNKLYCGGVVSVSVWKVEDEKQKKYLITQYDSQINDSSMACEGFGFNYKAVKLFSANRKTKTLNFINIF